MGVVSMHRSERAAARWDATILGYPVALEDRLAVPGAERHCDFWGVGGWIAPAASPSPHEEDEFPASS
jgi:hypothetical protein